jgi:hypothetical protein
MTASVLCALVSAAPAPAASQFDAATVHALCDHAVGFHTQPSAGGGLSAYTGDYSGAGPSLVTAYPGWGQSEPGGEIVMRVKFRHAGGTIAARDDTPTDVADVFILRGSCKRGTMKLVGADATEVRIQDPAAGEYLFIVDTRAPAASPPVPLGHFTLGWGSEI